jgi:23S rRNA U2552 (ribose-2'-O)-methylase RlmE/FtsJ
MMIRIGNEMNKVTGAINLSTPGREPVIIDLCMAPGGFSFSALKSNPTAQLRGLSLPTELGGWEILLPRTPNTEVLYQDVTMLAAEMGVTKDEIPPDHADVNNFIHTRLFDDVKADLIFCGGGVQRLHDQHRAGYRQQTEGTRLTTSQLVFAMNRVRTGGTLVLLMHRPETWATAVLLYTFTQCADTVRCFKPRQGHVIRSSFYIVATGVRPGCEEAVRAVERWKETWRRNTLGKVKGDATGSNVDVKADEDEDGTGLFGYNVEDVIRDFGQQLIQLGRPVWRIQAAALKDANRKWGKKKTWEVNKAVRE